MSRQRREQQAKDRAAEQATRDDVHEQRQPGQRAEGMVDEDEAPPTEPEGRRDDAGPTPGANASAPAEPPPGEAS